MISAAEVINLTLSFWGVLAVLFLAADALTGGWGEAFNSFRQKSQPGGWGGSGVG